MSGFFVAATHAAGKGGEPDVVFAALKKANDAIASLGLDKVVNATVGAIYDDEENFATLEVVDDYYRQLPSEELMNYASIAGLPEYLQAAIDFTFQEYKPDNSYIKAVATPGGTGAVRHIMYNYLEEGQKALIPDWFWGPYKTIADENRRLIDTYQMYDENNKFILDSIKAKSKEILKEQNQLVIIFNTPGHNPTGHSINLKEWKEILDFYRACAADKQKKIVLLLDIAYIDYAGDPKETRKFLKLFEGLPENILITMAFSMSKSFMMYGMRSGAAIALSSSLEVVEEFARINSFSNRGLWSNGTRGAQKFLANVMANPELSAKINAEREKYCKMVEKRAGIFMKEAGEIGLKPLPYHGGFFITVPVANPLAVAAKLQESNIFVVPLKKGVRFAICSVPTGKIPGLAAKTLEAMNN